MNEKILEKINETIDLGNPSFNERIANAFDYLEKKKKYTLADKFLHNVLNDVDILNNCFHCSFLSILYNNEEDKNILLILCAFNIINVDEELDNPNSLYKGTHLSTSVKDKFFKFLDKGNVDMTINCKSCDSLQKTIWENIKEEEKQNIFSYDIIKSIYKNEKNGIKYISLSNVYQKKELRDILIKCYNYLSDKYSHSLAETFLGRILFDETSKQNVNDTYEHLRHLNSVDNIEKIRLFIAVVFHVNLSSLEDYLSDNLNKGTHLSTYPEETINNYEFVNHPSHYNEWSMEVIDMMEKIYGTENTIMWCEMTAYKYAMRMGFKPTDDIQQDIDKRNWYLNKAKELKQKLN